MRKNAVTSSMNMTSIKSKGPVFDPGLCRCCGSMRKCRLLNVEYESLGKKEVYSDMIMDCFGLLLSHLDGKPTERLVCATCVGRLREAASFKQQVLQCEETFIQVKLQYTDDEPKPCAEVFLDGGDAAKVEVKIEPQECDAGQTSHDDAAADDDYEDVKSELPVDESSNDDLPLSERVSNKIVKRNPAKIERPKKSAVNGSRISPGQGFKKTGVPMAKVQQMIRERDPSYMIETNILTIVEYSYVCPFKCRHNHLLCYYCGKNYSDPHELRQHTLTMHHPKKFKVIEHKKMIKIDLTRIDCRLCSAKIDNLEEFKRHVSSLHNKKYYFDYKDSVLPFKLTSGDLNCALCDETFPYFHALNKHMNEHFSNYVCETCGLGFVDKSRWKMHQQRHEEGDFPCETCGKVFKAQYNRDLHIDRVHKKKGRVYCPKCDMKLMSYPQKLKHLVEVHGEEPLSFPCNICGKIYETRRTLTIHKRKEHLKDYRYECQYCGQKFFTRFALNNHMPTHTGERNFKCKVCEKTYPRLKTLKDHMRIHTNDRRYRCHICGQAFIQNCSLKGHMKSQHSEYG